MKIWDVSRNDEESLFSLEQLGFFKKHERAHNPPFIFLMANEKVISECRKFVVEIHLLKQHKVYVQWLKNLKTTTKKRKKK